MKCSTWVRASLFFFFHFTLHMHRVVGQVPQDLTHSTKSLLLVVKSAMYRRNEFGKIPAELTATDFRKLRLHKKERKEKGEETTEKPQITKKFTTVFSLSISETKSNSVKKKRLFFPSFSSVPSCSLNVIVITVIHSNYFFFFFFVLGLQRRDSKSVFFHT